MFRKFRRFRKYNTVLKPFGRYLKKTLVISGYQDVTWHYGGAGESGNNGKNEKYYKAFDVLASVNGDYNTHYWTFLAGAFHRYIINKITVYLSDFNISDRYQEDCRQPLDYSSFIINEKVNYPFANGKFFVSNEVGGTAGMYMRLIRSTDKESDLLLPLSHAYLTKFTRVECRGSSRRGRRSVKLVYYPKCKKPVEINEANLPFKTRTLETILGFMEPKHDLLFRILLGWGPYKANVDEKVSTEAYEVSVRFKTSVVVGMTLVRGNVSDITN